MRGGAQGVPPERGGGREMGARWWVRVRDAGSLKAGEDGA